MFKRLRAMAIEIVLGALQVMFGIPHCLQCLVNVWMWFRHGRCRCGRWCYYGRGRHRRRGRLRSGCRRWKRDHEQNCGHDEQSQKSNLFHVLLLVRIPARTLPIYFTSHAMELRCPRSEQGPRDFRKVYSLLLKKGMEGRLLRRCPSILPAVSPPQPYQAEYYYDRHRDIKPFYVVLQPLPVPAEQVTRTGDNGHPQGCAEKVEDQELSPRHAQNSRHGSCNDAHAKHKTRKEDSYRSVACKEIVSPLKSRIPDSK